MRQLAIENPRDTDADPNKCVDLLSRNVTAALFGTNHSSMNDVIDRVERKKQRRESLGGVL